MKRKLTAEEEKMTKFGLERNKEDLDKLNYNLSYNKALMAKQKYLRDWEDKWREPERLRKDMEDLEIIKMIESEIRLKEEAIKDLKEHLKDGVEVKVPTGVY